MINKPLFTDWLKAKGYHLMKELIWYDSSFKIVEHNEIRKKLAEWRKL